MNELLFPYDVLVVVMALTQIFELKDKEIILANDLDTTQVYTKLDIKQILYN